MKVKHSFKKVRIKVTRADVVMFPGVEADMFRTPKIGDEFIGYQEVVDGRFMDSVFVRYGPGKSDWCMYYMGDTCKEVFSLKYNA